MKKTKKKKEKKNKKKKKRIKGGNLKLEFSFWEGPMLVKDPKKQTRKNKKNVFWAVFISSGA